MNRVVILTFEGWPGPLQYAVAFVSASFIAERARWAARQPTRHYYDGQGVRRFDWKREAERLYRLIQS